MQLRWALHRGSLFGKPMYLIDIFAAMLAEWSAVPSNPLFAMGTSVIKIIGNQTAKHHDRANETKRCVQITGDYHNKANHHKNIAQESCIFVTHIQSPSK